MLRNRVLAAGAIAAALFAASIWASPYWSLYRMRAAVASHDAQAVSDRIDFPALRASVKDQLTAAMDRKGVASKPFGALGQAMAMALADPLVDAMVSPAGVIAMIEYGKPGLHRPDAADPEAEPASAPADKPDYTVGYRSWDQVALTLKGSGGGSFLFTRHGLWGWKLSGIEPPAPRN